jgi:hypothetical protein
MKCRDGYGFIIASIKESTNRIDFLELDDDDDDADDRNTCNNQFVCVWCWCSSEVDDFVVEDSNNNSTLDRNKFQASATILGGTIKWLVLAMVLPLEVVFVDVGKKSSAVHRVGSLLVGLVVLVSVVLVVAFVVRTSGNA